MDFESQILKYLQFYEYKFSPRITTTKSIESGLKDAYRAR